MRCAMNGHYTAVYSRASKGRAERFFLFASTDDDGGLFGSHGPAVKYVIYSTYTLHIFTFSVHTVYDFVYVVGNDSCPHAHAV